VVATPVWTTEWLAKPKKKWEGASKDVRILPIKKKEGWWKDSFH